MKAGFRVLMAGLWLAAAGPSLAQTPPSAGQPPLDGCGATCRFLHNLTAPAPAQEAQPKPLAEPPLDRPRRARRTTGRGASPTGEAARPKGGRASADVEETASLPRGAAEIVFVARPDETHRAVVGDLAGALGPDFALRALPGKGEPLRDVLSLPGADVTVASSLSLARAAASSDKLVYVAKLFTEELHALAAPGIGRVEDLAGQPVHLGPPDSDAELAAKTFLEARGVAVAPVPGSLAEALNGLREGRVAAVFVLAPKPFAPLTDVRSGAGLRLLPLDYRPSDTAFHPAALGGADYPGLIPEGGRVETVALDAVLVAPRWREGTDRQEELAAFAARLFDKLGALGEAGRHPKWGETNLAATIDGLHRLKPAQQWVAARLKARPADGAASRTAPGAAAR